MSASLNEVRLIGNLGKDPELRQANDADVCTISIATNSYRGRGEDRQKYTEWHRVVLWNQDARYAAEHLHKGDTVFVGGELRTRKWTDGNGIDQYTTEVVASDFQGLRLRDARQDEEDTETAEIQKPTRRRGGQSAPTA